MFIEACEWLGLASDLHKVNNEMIDKRVERSGNPAERVNKVLNNNTLIDYAIGFFFYYWVLIVTFICRYAIHGHL